MTPRAPEAEAREEIDRLLTAAGWVVSDLQDVDLAAYRGIAIREFSLKAGHGEADYLLYLDGKAVGVVEAKKKGSTLTGVETQSGKYANGLPDSLPAWRRPLPFAYESTGVETRFTSSLDPEPRSRGVFAFHRPETLRALLDAVAAPVSGEAQPAWKVGTFLSRVRQMPDLVTEWGDFKLWPARVVAIRNLEAFVCTVETEVDANFKRAALLRQAVLASAHQPSPEIGSCQ